MRLTNPFSNLPRCLAAAVFVTLAVARPGFGLEVASVSPARHALTAPVETRIRVEFDRPVERSSVTPRSFWAFGRWSGAAEGVFRFSADGRTVTLTPDRRFSAGEQVMVILSRDLTGADGSSLRRGGYSYQFWTRSRGTGFDLEEIDRLSTRSIPDVRTRAYGGFGSDLDGDGFLDLTIVNEDSNDLRVFLNRADRSGAFTDFLTPPAAVGQVPSPSEPSDFNRDGHVDVAVANTQDATVSILLGNGDGTFAPAEHVFVGGQPRGITVLDADGDGDVDVAATSFALGRVAVLANDGAGGFSADTIFGSNGGERAVAAGDMNDDGLLDLVVGALTAQEVQIWTNDGEGTFSLHDTQTSGGEVWMLVLGDVDRDGAEDVAVVNSQSDTGGILMGDGEGRLAAPRMTATDPFPLATDLADLDGDGDLDWVTSSFFGDWALYENNGSGSFSLAEAFAAPQAASCSLPMDIDNDGVLDLVLIDELSDDIVLMSSRARILDSGFESGDTREWSRAKGSLEVVHPGLDGSAHALAVSATKTRSFVESKRPNRETSLVLAFELDPGNVDLGGGSVEILRLGGGKAGASLTMERSGSRYRLRLGARDAAGERRLGSTRVRADRPVELQVEWSSASGPAFADGRAALRKNGRLRIMADDLANHGQTIQRIRLGLPRGAGASASGSFLVDEIAVTR